MKIFEVYKGIVNERQIEACVKNFGEELFSPQLGGDEPNTRLEDRYLELIHRFTDNEFGEETNPDFVTALNNLKKCTKQFPEVLTPQDTMVYRGITIPVSYFINNRLIINMDKEYEYEYKARSPIQSWSTSSKASESFGNHEIVNEIANFKVDLNDYQTPEDRRELLDLVIKEDMRMAFIISFMANEHQFIFNSEYFKVLSSMFVEEEVIRMTNKPIRVKAKFNNNKEARLSFEGLRLIKLVNQSISEL